jgi:hypothetical protein
MYIIALKNVQNSMDAAAYIQLRKLLDINFRAKYKYAVYAALLSNLLIAITYITSPFSIAYITSPVAFIALVADVLLTIKGNLPINNIINNWPAGDPPPGWRNYRAKWLCIFYYRQIATIAGFISLLAGTVLR